MGSPTVGKSPRSEHVRRRAGESHMLRRASLRAVQCVQTCVNYAQQAGDSLVLYICAIRHQLGQACPHLGRRPPLTDRQSTQGMKSKRLERRNLFAHGKLRR